MTHSGPAKRMRLGRIAVIAPLVLLAFRGTLRSDTPISGTISTNTTWTVAGSPYVLTGTVYVQGTGTPVLTIQPGVTVKFNSGADLAVSYTAPGALLAVGTSGSPILFTANGSTTPGFWHGLYIGNTTPASQSQISYATVEYGGWTTWTRGGIHIYGLSPTFSNVTVRNSVVAAITVNGGSPSITASTLTGNSGPGLLVTLGSPSITGSTIANNTGYAISAAPAASLSGLTGLTVSGNGPGKDLIERQAGTIVASQTWPAGSVPYVVTGALYVQGTGTPVLTIQPGVTVKFNSGADFAVSYTGPGALQAVGTSGSPILFTANGSTTPGFWHGLYIGNTTPASQSQISYATVEYGGWTTWSRGGIHVYGLSPTFDHLTTRNNVVSGISVDGGSPTVTNTLFSSNPAGITKTAAAATITARLDYWGAASGPSGGGPGTGQSIPAGTLYEPWLTLAPTISPFVSSVGITNRRFNPSSANLAGWSLVGNGTSSWTMTISNSGGLVVRNLAASGTNASFTWDGKNDSGVAQPDGTYSYLIQASGSGQSAAPATGFSFRDQTLQVALTAPGATQYLSNVYQAAVSDIAVTGTVAMASLSGWTVDYGSGSAPSSWTVIGTGTQAVTNGPLATWSTLPLTNGLYSVRLTGTDAQGDAIQAVVTPTVGNFKISQSAQQLNNSAGATITYTSTVPFTLTETLTIKNEAGQTIRNLYSGSRPAGSYNDVWNGKNDSSVVLPEGGYFHIASVTDGTHTMTWDLTSQYANDYWSFVTPTQSSTFDPYNNQPLTLTFTLAQPGRLSIIFGNTDPLHTNCAAPQMCLFQDRYVLSGSKSFTWAGTDGAGAYHPETTKVLVLISRYNFPKNAVAVGGTAPVISNLQLTKPMFSPVQGTQTVAFDVSSYQSQVVSVTINYLSQDTATVVRTLTFTNQTPGHLTYAFDGKDTGGGWLAPGNYTVTVQVTDGIGNTSTGQLLTSIDY